MLNLRDEIIRYFTHYVSSKSPVFPGDTRFSRHVHCSCSQDNMEVSHIRTTLHIGAHADAPKHYHDQGDSIEKRTLHYYYGKAQLIDVDASASELRILPHRMQDIDIEAPHVLIHTQSFGENWRSDFSALSVELVDYLHDQGVILVGIVTPSIDPANDRELLCHSAIFKHDMAVLEGLVLNEVPERLYTLIALPLKIKDGDASPVRAVLIA